MELAHAGAKVIFPPTMIPALYKSIPIRIKNTFEPDNPGTAITQDRARDDQFAVGISSLYNVSLIRFQGAGMVGRFGVIGRVFDALAKKKINIILVSQVFSEHSICFAIQFQPRLTKTAAAVASRTASRRLSLLLWVKECTIHLEFPENYFPFLAKKM